MVFKLRRCRQFLELNARELHLLEFVGLLRLARCDVLGLRGSRNVDVLFVICFTMTVYPPPKEQEDVCVKDDRKNAQDPLGGF